MVVDKTYKPNRHIHSQVVKLGRIHPLGIGLDEFYCTLTSARRKARKINTWCIFQVIQSISTLAVGLSTASPGSMTRISIAEPVAQKKIPKDVLSRRKYRQ